MTPETRRKIDQLKHAAARLVRGRSYVDCGQLSSVLLAYAHLRGIEGVRIHLGEGRWHDDKGAPLFIEGRCDHVWLSVDGVLHDPKEWVLRTGLLGTVLLGKYKRSNEVGGKGGFTWAGFRALKLVDADEYRLYLKLAQHLVDELGGTLKGLGAVTPRAQAWRSTLNRMQRRIARKHSGWTWTTGGCFAFAAAFQAAYGGELYGIARQDPRSHDFPVNHALVKLRGVFYDYDGPFDVSKLRKGEQVLPRSHPDVHWFDDDFLDDADWAELHAVLRRAAG